MSNSELTVNPGELCIISILTHSGDSVGLTRLKLLVYLSDKKLGDKYDLYSYKKGNVGPEPKQLKSNINSLSSKELVTVNESVTAGGNTKYSYYLNHEYEDIISKFNNKNNDIIEFHTIIGKIYNRYKNTSIHGLISIVKENYPKYFRNNLQVVGGRVLRGLTPKVNADHYKPKLLNTNQSKNHTTNI